jgi:hypothetical protein
MGHDTTPLRVERDPSQGPTQGVRIRDRDFGPEAAGIDTDFFPPEALAVIRERDALTRQNNARALRSSVLNAGQNHAYWKGDKAWQVAMARLTAIALGDE